MICLTHTERVWKGWVLFIFTLVDTFSFISYATSYLILPSSFLTQQYLALKSAAKKCFFFHWTNLSNIPFSLQINHFLSGYRIILVVSKKNVNRTGARLMFFKSLHVAVPVMIRSINHRLLSKDVTYWIIDGESRELDKCWQNINHPRSLSRFLEQRNVHRFIHYIMDVGPGRNLGETRKNSSHLYLSEDFYLLLT